MTSVKLFFRNYLKNNLGKVVVYILVSLVFIFCFIFTNKFYNVADFVSDYGLIENYLNFGVNYDTLFFAKNMGVSFFYNLFVISNVKFFGLSFTFLKIVNFFVSFILFTLTYFLIFKNKNNKSTFVIVSILFTLLLSNIFIIFDYNTQLQVKFILLNTLITCLTFQKASESKTELTKYLLLIISALLSILSFTPLVIPVYIFYILKIKNMSKKDKIIFSSTLFFIILVPCLLSYKVFYAPALTIKVTDSIIKNLYSIFIPNNIYQPLSTYKIMNVLVAGFAVIFIVSYFVFKIYKRQIDLHFFLLLGLIVNLTFGSIYLVDNPNFYGTLYTYNSFISTMLIYDLFINIDESKCFNLYNNNKFSFSFSKSLTFIYILCFVLTNAYSFETLAMRNKNYKGFDNYPLYTIVYNLKDSQTFEGYSIGNVSSEEYYTIINYYKKNNLLNFVYKIPFDKTLNSINNFKKIEGFVETSNNNDIWTLKKCTFALYNECNNITFDLESFADTKLDVTINNETTSYDLIKGTNTITINISNFINDALFINFSFKDDVFNSELKTNVSCLIKNITLTSINSNELIYLEEEL